MYLFVLIFIFYCRPIGRQSAIECFSNNKIIFIYYLNGTAYHALRCLCWQGRAPSTHLSLKTKTVANQGLLKCTYHYFMEQGRGEQVNKINLKKKTITVKMNRNV